MKNKYEGRWNTKEQKRKKAGNEGIIKKEEIINMKEYIRNNKREGGKNKEDLRRKKREGRLKKE